MKQTKAQRLAAAIESRTTTYGEHREAAALLLRQYELLKQALEAMEEAHDQSLDGMHFRCRQTLQAQISSIRAHLEAK